MHLLIKQAQITMYCVVTFKEDSVCGTLLVYPCKEAKFNLNLPDKVMTVVSCLVSILAI